MSESVSGLEDQELNSKLKLKPSVLAIVNRIPRGKVCYFGQLVEVLQMEHQITTTAHVVGWVMSGLKESEYNLCPWQRVVVKNGFVASLKLGTKGLLQIELLKSEGINVVDNVVDMAKYCVNTKQLYANSKQHESAIAQSF